MSPAFFSKDIVDFLFLLSKYKVKYVIVGGEAVIYYGHARLTGDIDIFYGLSKGNVEKLFHVASVTPHLNLPMLCTHHFCNCGSKNIGMSQIILIIRPINI